MEAAMTVQMPAGFVPDGFEPDDDLEAAPEQTDDGIETISLGKTVKNIPRSALNVVRDTVRGVGGLMTGLADDPMGTAQSIVPGIIDHYSSRYGSHGARGRTVQEDPVGMVMDMLPVGALRAAPAVGRATLRGARTGAANAAGFAAKHSTPLSTVAGAMPGVIAMGANPLAGWATALGGAMYGFDRAPAMGRRFTKIEKALRGGPTRQAAAAKSAAAAATLPDAVIAAEQAAAAAPSPAAAAAAPGAPAARPRPQPIEIPPSGAAAPMPSAAGGGASAPTAATGQEALAREMRFRDPEYWRTTDAVPIDALKPDSLGRARTTIEAGESYLGLSDRIAALLKDPTPANVEEAVRLAKGMRQRGHVTQKSPTKGKI